MSTSRQLNEGLGRDCGLLLSAWRRIICAIEGRNMGNKGPKRVVQLIAIKEQIRLMWQYPFYSTTTTIMSLEQQVLCFNYCWIWLLQWSFEISIICVIWIYFVSITPWEWRDYKNKNLPIPDINASLFLLSILGTKSEKTYTFSNKEYLQMTRLDNFLVMNTFIPTHLLALHTH